MEFQKQFNLSIWLTWSFFTCWMAITPIFPSYALSTGATVLDVGLILSLQSVTLILTRIPLGILARSMGNWSLIHLAFGLQAFSPLMFFLSPSYLWLFPVMVLYALSSAAFGSTAASLIMEQAPSQERGKVMGKYYASAGVAMVSGPVATGVLSNFVDYRGAFLALSIFPVLGTLAIARLKNRATYDLPDVPRDSMSNDVIMLFKLVKKGNMAIVVAASVLFSMVNGVFEALFPIYGKEQLMMTTFLISLLFALRAVFNTSVRMPSGRLSDVIGRKTPIVLGFMLAAFAFHLFSVNNLLITLAFGMIIFGIGWGLMAPNLHLS